MARAAAYGRPGQYNAAVGTDTFIFKSVFEKRSV